jgi:hypothetical protein
VERLFVQNGELAWWNILGFVFLLSVAVAFFTLLYRWIKMRNSSLERILRRNAQDVLMNVELPDGMGGVVYIDFLVLHCNGILVIDYKNFAGVLFGGEKTEQWTQVVNNKSFRFENPLYLNQQHVSAIRELMPSAQVQGMVIFSEEGEFPRGKPENVFELREFRDKVLKKSTNSISPLVLDEWQGLRNKVYIVKA